VTVSVSLDKESYIELQKMSRPTMATQEITMEAVPDTGSEYTIAGSHLLYTLGITKEDLVPVTLQLNATNHTVIEVKGAIFINIMAKAWDGTVAVTKQMCYVCPNIYHTLLSRSALHSLRIIPHDFPEVQPNKKRRRREIRRSKWRQGI